MRPCWVLALLFIDLGEHPVGVQRRYPWATLSARGRETMGPSPSARPTGSLVRSAAGKAAPESPRE